MRKIRRRKPRSPGKQGNTPDQPTDRKPAERGNAPPKVARTRNGDGRKPATNDQNVNGARAQAGPPPVYAALDLGTNNCRLLMAVPTRPGQFRVVDAFSRIVRLGEGLGRTGSLSRDAMDRAASALAVCAQKIAARNVTHMRLIATEACRAAANGAEFLERVERDTGLKLEIVSQEAEARLAVSGCGSLIEPSTRGAVLFDIGGGSSEIALLDLRDGPTRKLASRIVAWTSLPIGVVSMAERHGGRNVTPEVFEKMIVETTEMISDFPGRDRLDKLIDTPKFHLLGTSGTVTTLAGIHLNLERYDRRQVDGLWLTQQEADELVQRILGWSFEERVANPCIGSDRADLVLAGCAILEGIRRVWPARALRVADRGLREGLLIEMMIADRVWDRQGRRSA
ncbi:Ppx/GppA phosphatase family protein [Fulvimarina sp. MAC8]|uniref:Ppx/GppA phosphatase family protein n=1 Tax=Fulvimarina sp. MAC8 TaxID=3162874 RepID=UPI0032EECF52